MITLYIFTGCFMVFFFLCLLGFVVYTEKRREMSDKINQARFAELSEKISETQKLFKVEVSECLKSIKNFIK